MPKKTQTKDFNTCIITELKSEISVLYNDRQLHLMEFRSV